MSAQPEEMAPPGVDEVPDGTAASDSPLAAISQDVAAEAAAAAEQNVMTEPEDVARPDAATEAEDTAGQTLATESVAFSVPDADDVPADADPGVSPADPPLAANDAAPFALQAPVAPPAVDAPEPPDPADWQQALRLAEALIFAADRPITPQRLQPVLPERCDARAVLATLAEQRATDPVRLVEVAGGWAFRTAPELAPQLTRVVEVPRRLPRAAMETLAIIAYHQPVTRAEVEEIRGAALAQTTLESLLEMGLIQPRGRKEVPGRPSLWGTTTKFLEQFGLRSLNELPRREELVNEPTLPFAAPPAAA